MMQNYAPLEPIQGNSPWQDIQDIYSETDSTEYGDIFSYPPAQVGDVPSAMVDQGDDDEGIPTQDIRYT